MKGVISIFLLVSFCQVQLHAQNSAEASNDQLKYSILLIGDAGELNEYSRRNFKSIKENAQALGQNSAVVFLGDNIYPKGLPDEEHKDRAEAEAIINAQLDIVKDYKGKAIMVPGNHDWKRGHKGGLKRMSEVQDYIEAYLDSNQILTPQNGCPGPELIELTEEIVLIAYDSQWILHQSDRPGEEDDCSAKTALELLAQMEDLVKKNQDKKIILAAHHPAITYGMHGGRSNFRENVFPLTDANKSLYIPLPIIGSIYPLYRKYLGNVQDVAHPLYKRVNRSLFRLMQQYPNIVHVAGHEHSLQYNKRDSAHFVVSGSGAKKSYVRGGKWNQFAAQLEGYARLDFYASGDVKLVLIRPEENEDRVLFQKTLFNKPYTPKPEPNYDNLDFSNQKIKIHITDQYEASKGKHRWFGKNYRDVWKQEVELPVFDIGKEHGGLKIVQRGGGFQTKSLRLEADNGKQYVLRSIQKYTSKAIPKALQGSFAAEIVQDQISASHPYGAFAIPYLAEEAGIYHTNPIPVAIPDDPRFGQYREDFANTVALYEERPSGNWKDGDHFGNSKKIINTFKVLKSIQKDNDNRIDQEFVLRNRLFDLVIGDWDRHEDQWRWASFKEDKGKMYRPIPRDRDQAFFVNEGIVPKIASRKWALPKFQGFDHSTKNVPGFMFNARYFDRSFLNSLERDDWIKMAKDLQERLTDSVITDAIQKWPTAIYQHDGELIIEKLKSRRNHLVEDALKHYEFLSKEVDVVGSDKKELFEIERMPDGFTSVKVYKLSKKGKKKQELFSRKFNKKETKEIRLYGLGGKDQFNIYGKGNKAIKIRIIGGKGKDSIVDQSEVRGWCRKALVYDKKDNTFIDKGKETRNLTSNSSEVNTYNRKSFRYNQTLPLLVGKYNVDDGVFLGAGFQITTYGFRKDPFKNKHLFLAQGAFGSGAFDIKYKGTFNRALGSFDLLTQIDLEGPNYTLNYFGMGNESEFDQSNDIEFYRVRFDNTIARLYIQKRLGEHFSFAIGPKYEQYEIEEGSNRYLDVEVSQPDTNFAEQRYAGIGMQLVFDSRDNIQLPRKGVHLRITGKSLLGLKDNSGDFGGVRGFFSFYWTFRQPSPITLSNRIGGGINYGDFEFFQANTLGGSGDQINLRGYRRTRFYGNSSLYNNTELRVTLFGFKTYLFPSHLGLLFFNDIGRVWLENENSDEWHQSVGTGLWISPFESMVLSASVAFGEEEILPNFKFGFLF